MPSNAPIGVFDSGLGGLSVLQAIRALLPHESLRYVADSRFAPYGERSDTFIEQRSVAIGRWLREHGAKALVVACNTATAHGVAALRADAPWPVVGVEPGIKPAAAASRSGVIGVLATAATLRSARFADLLARHTAQGQRFLCQPGIGLVDRIEAGDVDSPQVMALLERYVAPMVAQGADTLVLGCTHYPFLIPAIERRFGTALTLVDTGAAIARQLRRRLQEEDLEAPGACASAGQAPARGDLRLFTTANAQALQTMADRLLPDSAHVQTVEIASERPSVLDLPPNLPIISA
ncbi:glutamate racemase [Pandoraea nosoerga]|uniref:Glutamate racemase n=1 Tax=Pandoraea nosoerga TaxID=2508296 RepID=A0A5E4XIM8_9BURK|nr:glutamate racemase [Pandoraea nosoerga]MBN4667172.1 glutamate racemase [Pandoraea nosoerga]MBN4677159.1 glutamate racemase [Pandoraea nosoerga]MBN4682020.1 glutamate racemase [Pandoraea nosoerga]MBN4746338.1 glutamate racemase [Pandoraea nosoerga]VVE36146.1 glutamate racemase [Pandoraea nosoerga]